MIWSLRLARWRLLLLLSLPLLIAGCQSSSPGPISESPVSPRTRAETSDRFLRSARNLGRQPEVIWHEVERWDFADMNSLGSLPQVAGEWELLHGKLVATGGEGNRAILLRPGLTGDLKVQFDVTLTSVFEGRIGDITVVLGATRDDQFFHTGYTATTGSFWNNVSTIYRRGRPLANTEYSPLEEGRTYRVTLERRGGHLRYWLNDTVLLEAWDSDPMTLSAERWFGIRTWHTRMEIDNLAFYRPVE